MDSLRTLRCLIALILILFERSASAQEADTLFFLGFDGIQGQYRYDEYNSLYGNDRHESGPSIAKDNISFPRLSTVTTAAGDTLEIEAKATGSQQFWYSGTFNVKLITLTSDLVSGVHLRVSQLKPQQRGGSSSSLDVKLKDVSIQWSSNSSASIILDSAQLSNSLVSLTRSSDWSAGSGNWTSHSSFAYDGSLASGAFLHLHIPNGVGLNRAQEPADKPRIALWPNPCTTTLAVDNLSGTPFSIVDPMGRSHQVTTLATSGEAIRIDVSALINGHYWVKTGIGDYTRFIVHR